MSIQIKFFGQLADAVGVPQLNISDISDIESLKRRILNDYPRLKKHQFMVVMSKQVINENINLRNGDVVELLPPFSGG